MATRATLARKDVLPLENGDTLTRDEFERRYEASPHIKKAELIEGVVYVAPPVSKHHSGPHSRMVAWAATYADQRGDIESHDNVTLLLSPTSEPQPDILLRYKVGGSSFSEEGYVEGVPELVIEIAASSASLDLHAKHRAYETAGIPEYLVWRTLENKVDWFVLEDGRYIAMEADAEGILESRQFPGLRLSVDVLLDGTLADLVALLR